MAVRIRSALAASLIACAALASAAQTSGVLGDWLTPAGSVVRIEKCGADVCLSIAVLAPNVPITDIHNPDRGLRSRSLCGLQIGNGFTLSGANHASGGKLYDPKTGKTYRGEMTADGAGLHLRGYVGIPLFGASETWTRTTAPVRPCPAERTH